MLIDVLFLEYNKTCATFGMVVASNGCGTFNKRRL